MALLVKLVRHPARLGHGFHKHAIVKWRVITGARPRTAWRGPPVPKHHLLQVRHANAAHLPRSAAQDIVLIDREASALPPARQDGLGGGGFAAGLARHHLRGRHQRLHQLLVVPRLLDLGASRQMVSLRALESARKGVEKSDGARWLQHKRRLINHRLHQTGTKPYDEHP